MRRRRSSPWLLPIVLWAPLLGHDGRAQTVLVPPALDDRQAPSAPGDPSGAPGSEGLAVAPASGPATHPRARRGWACPWAGWMRRCRRACRSTSRPRCNWPGPGRSTSPRRRSRSSRRWPCSSRPRPSGSRTSTRASTTSGTTASSRTSSRARTSRRGGRASSSAAGPACPSGSPTPSSPRWRRVGWSPRVGPTSRPRGTTACSRSPRPSSTSRRRGGGSSASGRRSRGPSCS